jgi:hypothetical protein
LTALDWYSDGAFGGTVKYVNNIIWNVKHGKCPAGSICQDPRLQNQTALRFNPALLAESPAKGAARSSKGNPIGHPNIGAVQPGTRSN